jgi:hypothetical protein
MAQKVNIILVDDLDESTADETVRFGLDGANYEIDLNKKNAKKLRDALAPYVAVSRKVRTPRSRGAAKAAAGGSAKEIREWARSNGYDVPDRGRVPNEIREAYAAAN